jgi:hypothetical protein
VLIVAGVVIDERLLESLTREFITLKARFYPRLVSHSRHRLGRILPEIKGADIRRALRTGARRHNRRQAIGFLNAFMDLLEYHDAKIFGRAWIKEVGGNCDDRATYTFSVQAVCEDFQNLLESTGDTGIVIADSRSPTPNAAVAHSVFTQKFKTAGDRYPRLLEMPTFGHSQNHAGLQAADLLCSALLFPMATHRYCTGGSGCFPNDMALACIACSTATKTTWAIAAGESQCPILLDTVEGRRCSEQSERSRHANSSSVGGDGFSLIRKQVPRMRATPQPAPRQD